MRLYQHSSAADDVILHWYIVLLFTIVYMIIINYYCYALCHITNTDYHTISDVLGYREVDANHAQRGVLAERRA